MNVVIACEFSGIVRDAFIERGHDAISIDLLPSERPGPHWQGDALAFDYGGADLVIAHPPCTYLANSGVRWLYGGGGVVRDETRWSMMLDAAAFMRSFLELPTRVAVENPIMHRYGMAAVGWTPDQTIQPWMFGHGETKATCLYLKDVPPLTPTDIVDGRAPRVHYASPGPDRWRERSRTLPGIAAAMADQWGSLPPLNQR